jgi:hypothetical protein
MGVADWWWGDPDRADEAGLRAMFSGGPPRLRIAAALALARRGVVDSAWLADSVPGVRRMAARGLGWRGRERGALEDAFGTEGTDTVRVALGAALLRCGATASRVLGGLGPISVDGGARASIPGVPPMRVALWWELGRIDEGPPPDRDAALEAGRVRLEDGDAGPWVPAIAALAPDWLLGRLPKLEASAGRREDHALLDAIGWLGDPRARPRLITALERMDIDPGRHYAERRVAAQALGRIGDPSVTAMISAALEREALEFEGRPGAGLGVQAPVRAVLLWALGELQSGGDLLAGYLGDSGGAALGIAAAEALRKHGMAVEDLLLARLDGPEAAARQAAAVLVSIGSARGKSRVETDPRLATADDPDVAEGVADLRARRWFEAHEAFEQAWKRSSGDRRRWLQSVIHLAVGLEHLRRGSRESATRQWRKSQEKRGPLPDVVAGAALRAWATQVDALFEATEVPSPETWPIPEAG